MFVSRCILVWLRDWLQLSGAAEDAKRARVEPRFRDVVRLTDDFRGNVRLPRDRLVGGEVRSERCAVSHDDPVFPRLGTDLFRRRRCSVVRRTTAHWDGRRDGHGRVADVHRGDVSEGATGHARFRSPTEHHAGHPARVRSRRRVHVAIPRDGRDRHPRHRDAIRSTQPGDAALLPAARSQEGSAQKSDSIARPRLRRERRMPRHRRKSGHRHAVQLERVQEARAVPASRRIRRADGLPTTHGHQRCHVLYGVDIPKCRIR